METQTILLTKGAVSLIDAEDYESFGQVKWYYDGRYAKRDQWVPGSPGHYKRLYLHRAILEAAPGTIVDHINGDTLDNRRVNLRFCNALQSAANSAKSRQPGSSVFKGVSRTPCGYWKAGIKADGKVYNLGIYNAEEDAALAYDAAARQYFGEYARLNFPEQPPVSLSEIQTRRRPHQRPRGTYPTGTGLDPRWNRWRACYGKNGRTVYVGMFATEEEAVRARQQAMDADR
jgi:hypothetical protein